MSEIHIPLAVKVGAAVGVGSFAVGMLAGECSANLENNRENSQNTLFLDQPPPITSSEFFIPPITCDPAKTVEAPADGLPNPDINPTLSLYLEANSNYESFNSRVVGSDGQLFLEGNPAGASELKRKALDHVANGLCLAQNTQELVGKFAVQGNLVIYKEETLQLDSSVDFQVLAGILKEEIQAANGSDRDSAEENIEHMLKLKHLPTAIFIEEGAFPILNSEHLVKLSQMQQLLLSEGLPKVDVVQFKGFRKGDPGGGWYMKAENGEPSTIVVTNHSTPSHTVPHEYGHHVAQSLDDKNTQLGLVGFTNGYVRLRERLGLSNAFDTTHEVEGRYTINPQEEYAEAFVKFINVVNPTTSGLEDEQIEKFEFEFFEKVFNGKSFVEFKPVTRIDPGAVTLGEIYRVSPRKGTTVMLFNPEFPGFQARTHIDKEIDLKIINGPHLFKDLEGNSVSGWEVAYFDTYKNVYVSHGWISGDSFVKLR